MQLDQLPPLLTVEEAARVLRIGRSAAYERVNDGSIPSVRIGRLLRVPKHRLVEIIDGTEKTGA